MDAKNDTGNGLFQKRYLRQGNLRCGREFGDDPEIVAPSVLAFIGGVLLDDVSRVRKAMSSLKMEKFLSGLPSFKLEKLFSGKK